MFRSHKNMLVDSNRNSRFMTVLSGRHYARFLLGGPPLPLPGAGRWDQKSEIKHRQGAI